MIGDFMAGFIFGSIIFMLLSLYFAWHLEKKIWKVQGEHLQLLLALKQVEFDFSTLPKMVIPIMILEDEEKKGETTHE